MTKGRKWQIVGVIALGLFMAILDNTIVSVTLPQMQKAFHTQYSTITWVATAYFLAQAAVIPMVGYVSDRIGSKLVFLVSLVLFTAGSLLCALAPNENFLIACRVFQGIGGGALIPVAFAIVYRIFPPAERGPATAIMGIPLLMAPAFGPTLGGYLGTNFDWNAIFTVNVPIGVVALLLGILVLPSRTYELEEEGVAEAIEGKKRFDIVGLILSMVGVTALVYGINRASTQGWGDQTVLTALLVGAVVLVAFVIVELMVSDPVLDLRLFKSYTFTIANIMLWVAAAVLFGALFLFPVFFENVRGETSLTTGEFLIAQGLATGVGMAVAGVLYNRVGPRILAVIGLLFLVGGTYGLTQITVTTGGWDLQPWLIARGLGLGLLNLPIQNLALSVVSNKAMAKASSLVNATRQIFAAVGLALLTTYLTQQATTNATSIGSDIKAGLATHQFSGTALICVQAGGPTGNQALIQKCVMQYATVSGLTSTFWIVLGVCAATIVLALIAGRDPAIEAYKAAKARGEDVKLERQAVLSE